MSVYGHYIERLTRKINSRFSGIETVYNFDYGPEFEIAVCELLSDILPDKFGVCRGFVVDREGNKAGDDIVIFDKQSSPTLRSFSAQQFAIKEQIPLEAVYAYIECKNSISDEQVFNKAISQVRSVKSLLLTRQANVNPNYNEKGPVYNNKIRDWPKPFPRLKNQPFCVIMARNYNGYIPKEETILNDHQTPDLIVIGKDCLMNQTVHLGPDGIKSSLFFDKDYSAGIRQTDVNGTAFSLGILTLMHALDWIELLPIDWGNILNDAFWTELGKKK